jgi:hypothetical protein
MNSDNKKLSLGDFKKKVNERGSAQSLNQITGGILGSCHCTVYQTYSTSSVTYCVYY